MPDPKQHAETRGIIEGVLRRIPGFRGYLEKEYRRESDALLREALSDTLLRAKRGLDDYTRSLVDAGQIDVLPQCDRLRGRIDKVSARIRGAMKGYSGFFDLVQVNEATLDRVYQYDSDMVAWVDRFGENLENISDRTEPPAEVVGDMLTQLEEFERSWDGREDLLKGVE